MVHSQPPGLQPWELVPTHHSAKTSIGEAWEVFPRGSCRERNPRPGVLEGHFSALPPTNSVKPPLPQRRKSNTQGFPATPPRVHYSRSQCGEAGRRRALLFLGGRHIAGGSGVLVPAGRPARRKFCRPQWRPTTNAGLHLLKGGWCVHVSARAQPECSRTFQVSIYFNCTSVKSIR